jgi:Ca2+-binding EF-hand superfamily protein
MSLSLARTLTDPFTTEFRKFVHETEKELLALFNSIDRDHDNKLTKDELQAAFRAYFAVFRIISFADSV